MGDATQGVDRDAVVAAFEAGDYRLGYRCFVRDPFPLPCFFTVSDIRCTCVCGASAPIGIEADGRHNKESPHFERDFLIRVRALGLLSISTLSAMTLKKCFGPPVSNCRMTTFTSQSSMRSTNVQNSATDATSIFSPWRSTTTFSSMRRYSITARGFLIICSM